MKTPARHFIKHLGLNLLVLITAFIWTTGCVGWHVHHPDPLAGWKFCYSDNPARSNKAIANDYKQYIDELPEKEKKCIGSINIYEDTTSQHAVRITILLNGTYVMRVLIYDKNDKRTRVIKYNAGHYMS